MDVGIIDALFELVPAKLDNITFGNFKIAWRHCRASRLLLCRIDPPNTSHRQLHGIVLSSELQLDVEDYYQFMHDLFRLVIDRLFDYSDLGRRIWMLYTLYALFSTQAPPLDYARAVITIPQSAWFPLSQLYKQVSHLSSPRDPYCVFQLLLYFGAFAGAVEYLTFPHIDIEPNALQREMLDGMGNHGWLVFERKESPLANNSNTKPTMVNHNTTASSNHDDNGNYQGTTNSTGDNTNTSHDIPPNHPPELFVLGDIDDEDVFHLATNDELTLDQCIDFSTTVIENTLVNSKSKGSANHNDTSRSNNSSSTVYSNNNNNNIINNNNLTTPQKGFISKPNYRFGHLLGAPSPSFSDIFSPSPSHLSYYLPPSLSSQAQSSPPASSEEHPTLHPPPSVAHVGSPLPPPRIYADTYMKNALSADPHEVPVILRMSDTGVFKTLRYRQTAYLQAINDITKTLTQDDDRTSRVNKNGNVNSSNSNSALKDDDNHFVFPSLAVNAEHLISETVNVLRDHDAKVRPSVKRLSNMTLRQVALSNPQPTAPSPTPSKPRSETRHSSTSTNTVVPPSSSLIPSSHTPTGTIATISMASITDAFLDNYPSITPSISNHATSQPTEPTPVLRQIRGKYLKRSSIGFPLSVTHPRSLHELKLKANGRRPVHPPVRSNQNNTTSSNNNNSSDNNNASTTTPAADNVSQLSNESNLTNNISRVGLASVPGWVGPPPPPPPRTEKEKARDRARKYRRKKRGNAGIDVLNGFLPPSKIERPRELAKKTNKGRKRRDQESEMYVRSGGLTGAMAAQYNAMEGDAGVEANQSNAIYEYSNMLAASPAPPFPATETAITSSSHFDTVPVTSLNNNNTMDNNNNSSNDLLISSSQPLERRASLLATSSLLSPPLATPSYSSLSQTLLSPSSSSHVALFQGDSLASSTSSSTFVPSLSSPPPDRQTTAGNMSSKETRRLGVKEKRGRPRKTIGEETKDVPSNHLNHDDMNDHDLPRNVRTPTSRNKAPITSGGAVDGANETGPKKRGRPRKVVASEPTQVSTVPTPVSSTPLNADSILLAASRANASASASNRGT